MLLAKWHRMGSCAYSMESALCNQSLHLLLTSNVEMNEGFAIYINIDINRQSQYIL
jgi:hypothetical protein